MENNEKIYISRQTEISWTFMIIVHISWFITDLLDFSGKNKKI